MERNRDLRRASVSAVNGLPRRRQRITTLRDSTDQDRHMDLQETVRLGDREQFHKKDREREFPKRRRIDRSTLQQRSDGVESYRENESSDSSDEEYYEEEEETRIHQHNRTNHVSPTSSSLSNNRRGLRTLRSSPVLRVAADEMFGVAIPRRARSASAKRMHEYCNSGSGGFGDDLSHRRFSPSPATACPIGSGSASPSSSGASTKKKMKSVDRKTPVFDGASNPNSSVIQDDIEIEVAEALFDLMKQSQSQSQSSRGQEKVDRDSIITASDELKMSKADGGKDENNAFSVQNEPSIKVNAETILADPVKEFKREGRIERERFPDDPAQDLVNGDGFVNKVKVGSPKESESPSCVIKVNACDIQDPTVTKAHNEAIIAESKKETKLEIDLMALPPVPPSPERDGLVDMETNTELTSQIVQKKSETLLKDSPEAVSVGMQGESIGINNSELHMEKHRPDEIASVSKSNTQQQQGRKEQKNQSPASLFPFPMGMSSWPGVLPHPGCIPPIQGVLPINGSFRSSTITQPPQFKFSHPRSRRCATHQFLAHNIHTHQELMQKDLSSGSAGPAALCGTKPSNLKYMLPPTQNFIPENPLVGDFQGAQNSVTALVESVKVNCDAAMASNANATISEKSVLQQASHPPSASNFFRGPGFIFPYGHHHTAMMANSSGSPQSSSTVGNASLPSNRLSVNLPLPGASSAVSLSHQLFPSNEAYMAMLQNNGCPIPISTNITMPSFKGVSPSMPFFNPSLYTSHMFNVSQNQQQLTIPHAPVQSAPQTTNSSSHKQIQSQKQTSDNKFPTSATTSSQQLVANGSAKPGNSQPMNFAMIPPVSVGGGGSGSGNKSIDPTQQGSKGGRAELVPHAFALSFGSNGSSSSALNFSSMAHNSAMFHMLPDMSWNGNQMKNFQASEGMSLTSSCQTFNISKTECKELSGLSTVGPPKFDGLARSINFLPSSLTGNQQNQQHLIQAQNSQMHQLQLAGSMPQLKPSNGFSGSFHTNTFPSNNHPVFAQVSIPNESSSIPQLKSSQGQTHINFGNTQTPATSFPNSRSNIIGQRSASTIGTGASTTLVLPLQEAEATTGGTGQKSSSPACRRIVPSILSTCPTQLPELKY